MAEHSPQTQLEMLLQSLFAQERDLAWCVADATQAFVDELHESEREHIKIAVQSRQLEYAAGRACARTAMQKLGESAQALPSFADRSPDWPEALVGSISHTHQLCAAVVAKHQHYAALGLDVEQADPLSATLQERVLRQEEIADAHAAHQDPAAYGKLIFCIKEAAYKCQYSLSKKYLGFSALRVTLDSKTSTFRAVFCEPAPPFAIDDAIEGRFAHNQSFVVALAMIAAAEQA